MSDLTCSSDPSPSSAPSADNSLTPAPSTNTNTDTCSLNPLSSIPIEEAHKYCVLDGSIRRLPAIVPCLNPFTRELVKGQTYKWCTCGRSKTQPWCDDSHKSNDPGPIIFEAPPTSQKKFLICGCKYTSKPPYCDGSHIHVKVGYEE